MTTHIFDQNGKFFSEGKNLRVVLSHARKRGVDRIKGIRKQGRWAVALNMHYSDGFTAVYNFADESICREFHEKRWPGKLTIVDEFTPHK